jgi:hypothetical protein
MRSGFKNGCTFLTFHCDALVQGFLDIMVTECEVHSSALQQGGESSAVSTQRGKKHWAAAYADENQLVPVSTSNFLPVREGAYSSIVPLRRNSTQRHVDPSAPSLDPLRAFRTEHYTSRSVRDVDVSRANAEYVYTPRGSGSPDSSETMHANITNLRDQYEREPSSEGQKKSEAYTEASMRRVAAKNEGESLPVEHGPSSMHPASKGRTLRMNTEQITQQDAHLDASTHYLFRRAHDWLFAGWWDTSLLPLCTTLLLLASSSCAASNRRIQHSTRLAG